MYLLQVLGTSRALWRDTFLVSLCKLPCKALLVSSPPPLQLIHTIHMEWCKGGQYSLSPYSNTGEKGAPPYWQGAGCLEEQPSSAVTPKPECICVDLHVSYRGYPPQRFSLNQSIQIGRLQISLKGQDLISGIHRHVVRVGTGTDTFAVQLWYGIVLLHHLQFWMNAPRGAQRVFLFSKHRTLWPQKPQCEHITDTYIQEWVNMQQGVGALWQ